MFLNPGIGYGGSCFPKDVRALEHIALAHHYPAALLHAVESVNRDQVELTVTKLDRELGGLPGRVVAVLGLAFKPNTDDTRDSPAIAVIRRLLDRGATVRAHDPIAMPPSQAGWPADRIAFFDDMYEAIAGSDGVLLATEWNEFRTLDFQRCAAAMRGDLLVDGRNIFDPDNVRAAKLRYVGVGRVRPEQPPGVRGRPPPQGDRGRSQEGPAVTRH
jgi:UDPglucose 6-dehydrogenase